MDYDSIVIGGGPAGMMAALRARERNLRVLLIEKNETLGKKLLITGGGRCNVTNATMDTRTLLKRYGLAEPFLFSAFSQWDVQKSLDFFHTRNMPTKIENDNRVFPVSNSARSVWEVLVNSMKKAGVEVMSGTSVKGFETSGGEKINDDTKSNRKITTVIIAGAGKTVKTISAKHFILATGGTSRPETGSTGDGYAWLRELGHTVRNPEASLVPILVAEPWVANLAGLSLKDVKVTVGIGASVTAKKFQSKKTGTKLLFTHVGLSGPTILNMSADIRGLLDWSDVEGDVMISLDLFPALDHGMMNTKLQDIFMENTNKKFKNAFAGFLEPKLAPIVVELSKIDPEKEVNLVTRAERLTLIEILKNFTLTVTGLQGLDKAIISSGGVALDEIDWKTMKSRLYPNLSIVGDVLDIDRPSGGYSLQLCWTTGFVAGEHA